MFKPTDKTTKIEILILVLLAISQCTYEYETKYLIDDFSQGKGETLYFDTLPSFQCYDKSGYANPLCEQDYYNVNEEQVTSVPGGVRITEYIYNSEAAHYAQNDLAATATGSILFNNAFSTSLNVTNTGDDDIFVFITTTLNYIQYPSCIKNDTTGKYSPSGCEDYLGKEVNLIKNGGDALAFKFRSQTLNEPGVIVGAKSVSTSPYLDEFSGYFRVTVGGYYYDDTTDDYIVPLNYFFEDDYGEIDFTRTTQLQFELSASLYCCVEEYQMLASGDYSTFDFELSDIRIVSTTDTNSLSSQSSGLSSGSSDNSSNDSSNNSSSSSPLFNYHSLLFVLLICFFFCLF